MNRISQELNVLSHPVIQAVVFFFSLLALVAGWPNLMATIGSILIFAGFIGSAMLDKVVYVDSSHIYIKPRFGQEYTILKDQVLRMYEGGYLAGVYTVVWKEKEGLHKAFEFFPRVHKTFYKHPSFVKFVQEIEKQQDT
ncbi:hypothetical protein TDB9533_03168 [Thalassocella blandensis]|nr:hypothetical protein TDB9533_03168 [Thalassocella blandensis]